MATRPRAPLHDLAAGERPLPPERGHYLARVLRLRDGDAFVAFDPETQTECDGEVRSVAGRAVVVALGPPRPATLPSRRSITWIHGLAKGDKCDAIVRDVTELGATAVAFAVTARAVVRLDGARARQREERWARIAEEAARQCGRADVPVVLPVASWAAHLQRVAPCAGARFCLWERAAAPLGWALPSALAAFEPLVFAAGPEGGLTEEEARVAEEAGFHLVSLGRRILRTETVPAAVLGAVAVLQADESGEGPRDASRS